MATPVFASAAEMYTFLPPDAQALVRRFVTHPAATALWGSRKFRSLWGLANGWYGDWEDRRDIILERGLPARIEGAVLEGDFLAINIEADEAHLIRSHASRGFRLHISIGYASDWCNGFAETGVEAINKVWRGRKVVLKIAWFGTGGAAFLADDEPLALDYNVSWLYSRGWYSDRGLHISL